MNNKVHFTIPKGSSFKTLPQVLFHLKELKLPSLKKARKLIERGLCTVNGRLARFATTKVFPSDVVEVIISEESDSSKSLSKILYEDEFFYVVDKAPHLIVDEKSVIHELCIPSIKCHLVHRLDKGTSGLLLIAKDEKTKLYFEKLFREKTIQKEYLALLDGKVKEEKGVVKRPLKLKERHAKEAFFIIAGKHEGKEAETHFITLLSTDQASFVRIIPKTGRTHQIRVHMASLSHPVLGDYRYGNHFRSSIRPKRHFLHAWKLSFVHPYSQEKLTFIAPLPPDMEEGAKCIFGSHFEEVLCALSS